MYLTAHHNLFKMISLVANSHFQSQLAEDWLLACAVSYGLPPNPTMAFICSATHGQLNCLPGIYVVHILYAQVEANHIGAL